MPTDILTLFEINTFILLGSTIVMAVLSCIYLRAQKNFFTLMLIVPTLAALAYALMSQGVGFIQMTDGVVNSMRYADWIVTTPIILFILSYVSIPDTRKRLKTFSILLLADIVMLAAGFGAELFADEYKILLFTVSTIAYIGILYIVIELIISLNRSVSDQRQRSVALTMAWIILILWSFYPFIWVFGSQGIMAIGIEIETIAYMILDVLTKVGFASLLLWYLYLQEGSNVKNN